MSCNSGINWEPQEGGPIWLANGQTFEHEISVPDPWPVGTTSWLDIDGVTGHFVAGSLSADRLTFSYRVETPGSDDTVVADLARYRFWLKVPNAVVSGFDTWKWFIGEVRRKDD